MYPYAFLGLQGPDLSHAAFVELDSSHEVQVAKIVLIRDLHHVTLVMVACLVGVDGLEPSVHISVLHELRNELGE